MVVAVFGKRRQGQHLANVDRTLQLLVERGVRLLIEERLATALQNNNVQLPSNVTILPQQCNDFSADLAISIGGDGTFLHTAHRVVDKPIPILGINTGSLGYLAGATAENPQQLVDDILNFNFEIEERSLITMGIDGLTTNDMREWAFALNEVAVMKEETASMLHVDTELDGSALATYPADGLIIATPTGSTAYSLSVGGPIVQPSAPVWVISPVAAHSLTMRPLIVSDHSVLKLKVDSRARHFRLSLDGISTLLPTGCVITLKRANFTIKIVKPKGTTFAQTLRHKLMWGIDQR